MKKIISFDLDGTLVHGKYGDIVWNRGIPEEYAGKYGLTFDVAVSRVRERYEAVGDTRMEWYNIDYWLRRFDLSVTAAELLNRYESRIEPLPNTAEVLQALKGKYTLIIASNAARIFVEKELSHTGLGRYFDHVISATTDYGMVKKEEHFYRRLCRSLDVSPHEIVHVGDHRIFDFEAPLRLGIEAYHLAQDGETGPGVIHNLRELLRKL
ncbi:MAG: HAD family hydrolase [Syntrophorhabdus aromaticivorans]|uniref:HAD family hydrolase n=1 Tax=Syntrophorhabdus aromaticivorans TaxID=328301 RepID=A0A971M3B4_9BACT|nr:HAD family hydrolase [Syntrophorhabdus aromaticivorans]